MNNGQKGMSLVERYSAIKVNDHGEPVVADYGMVIQIANYMCEHGMSFGHQPRSAAGAIAYGRSIGKGPFWALKNIAMVRDKPTIWGEGLKALATEKSYCGGFLSGAMSGPEIGVYLKEDFGRETATDEMHRELQRALRMRAAHVGSKAMGSPDYMVGYSVTKNLDSKLVRVSLFDTYDSATAGLQGGNMYRKWPRRMLMHRAFAFLIKDFYPEAMVGAMMAEEAIEDRAIEVQATPVARTVDDLLPRGDAPIDAECEEAADEPVDDAPPPEAVQPRTEDEDSLLERLKAVHVKLVERGEDAKEVFRGLSKGRTWADSTLHEKTEVVEAAEALVAEA